MTALVAQLGPLGVFLLMVPESACIPLPSELTLLTAGFGVHQGWFSFPVAVAMATAGNVVGSLFAYWLGRKQVLSKLPRNGGAVVARCERLLERGGERTVFTARLLPLARTFISLPAGHVGIPLRRFVPLTAAGCAIWSAAFILAGYLAGSGWERIASTAGRVSLVIGALLLAALALVPTPRTTRD
jgi:membrane protein DedA with SNARE-associated domain